MFKSVLKTLGFRGHSSVLLSPLAGKVIPLSDVHDPMFSSGSLGEGVAIEPTGGKVVAPSDSKVKAIFPSGHAVALHTNEGLDVLDGRLQIVKGAVELGYNRTRLGNDVGDLGDGLGNVGVERLDRFAGTARRERDLYDRPYADDDQHDERDGDDDVHSVLPGLGLADCFGRRRTQGRTAGTLLLLYPIRSA